MSQNIILPLIIFLPQPFKKVTTIRFLFLFLFFVTTVPKSQAAVTDTRRDLPPNPRPRPLLGVMVTTMLGIKSRHEALDTTDWGLLDLTRTPANICTSQYMPLL